MSKVHTCFVLGECGVGKSTFINAITGTKQCYCSDSPYPCTKYYQLVKTEFENETFQFIDTPAIDNPSIFDNSQNEMSIKEIKDAISKYSNIQVLIILLSYENPRISQGFNNALKTYMKIFPFKDFWSHVIFIYTKSYSRHSKHELDYKRSKVLDKTINGLRNTFGLKTNIPIFFGDFSGEENWEMEFTKNEILSCIKKFI